jgi:putative oxidoreductase
MSIVRRLARPLLAASFVTGGLDAVLHPTPRAEAARPLVERLAPPLGLPADPELFVRGNGAAMVLAGVLFATGRLPRLTSVLLAATLLPSTYTEHAFWQEKDPQARHVQQTLFLKNLGLLGGTLLAAVDTEGRPGLAWRSRRAVGQAEKAGRRAGRQARRSAREARRAGRSAAKDVKATAVHARDTARLQSRDARDAVRSAGSALQH